MAVFFDVQKINLPNACVCLPSVIFTHGASSLLSHFNKAWAIFWQFVMATDNALNTFTLEQYKHVRFILYPCVI